MTQEDKSLEYTLTSLTTFPFAILFAILFGFVAWSYNPHLGPRILLSIPFILIGYGAFVYPIADLAGMHKLNAIGAIVYTLLTTLFIIFVALLLASAPVHHVPRHVHWMVIYATLGMSATIVASGYTYFRLDREQDQPCGLEYN